jgi:hypothetical protein
MTDTILRSYLGNINVQVPFVYYRAEISQKGLEYVIPSTNPSKLKFASAALGTPRPYWSEQTKGWVNPTSYQILFCGFDNKFGPGNSFPSGTTIWTPNDVPKLYVPGSTAIDPNRTLVFPYVADPTNPDNSNFDDITNFAGGAVGDSIP